MSWHYDPHSGGNKIPPQIYEEIRAAVHSYEQTRPWYPKHSLKLRFKGQFCYVDSCENDYISPLGRLRYFSKDQWSLGFFTYSNERYEPCFLANGKMCGSIEDAIRPCEVYLT